MNIKKGDVLKYKDKFSITKTVLSVNHEDNLAVLSSMDNPKKASGVFTFSEIEELFEVPKEEWVPKKGETVFFIDTSLGLAIVQGCTFDGGYWDKDTLENDALWSTKESALLVADQINELIKNSNKG